MVLCLTGCVSDYDWVSLRDQHAIEDVDDILEEAYIPPYPLTLSDILRIALIQNLDLQVQRDELAAQAAIAAAENYKMIPPLTVDGIYSRRSNNTATAILTPAGVQPPQISSTQDTRQWDIRQTINLLDFGLSYFRAQQERGKAQLLAQTQLRVRQKLIFDIVQAYWKAIVAQKTLGRSLVIVEEAEEAQAQLEMQIARKNISTVDALKQEGHLIEMHNRLFAIRFQLESAKAELAEYMGLPPCTYFELADVEILESCGQQVESIESLEEQSLYWRPELVVKDLEEKIAVEDARIATLQMMPNATTFGDYNADGNPFLVHNYWLSAGVRATWNLLSFPQRIAEYHAGKAREEQAYRARLALTVAVLTQVRLAYLNYQTALEQYQISMQYALVKDRLYAATLAGKQAGDMNKLDVINFAEQALTANIAALKAYADLEVAKEQLGFVIGKPLRFTPVNLEEDAGYLEEDACYAEEF